MRRSDQKEETRRLILAAARAAFEAHGFEKATIRGIARAADVAPGTVFVHFSDKTDLLYTVLFSDLQAASARALATLPRPPDAPIALTLRHVAEVFLRHYAERPALSRTLLEKSLMAGGPWGARFKAQVHTLGLALIDSFEAAKDAGELRPEANSPLLTLAFFSFYYFLLIDAAGHDFADLDGSLARLDALVAQQLHGYRPE